VGLAWVGTALEVHFIGRLKFSAPICPQNNRLLGRIPADKGGRETLAVAL